MTVKTPEQEIEELRQLQVVTKSFFDNFLNVVEETDNGVEFFPIQVSCCRVMKLEPLNEVLKQMQQLSGAKPKPSLYRLITD